MDHANKSKWDKKGCVYQMVHGKKRSTKKPLGLTARLVKDAKH